MIRQLSLVAYLMSRRGGKVDARTIRWEVEGYGDEHQSDEAFARRFYADRAELAELGIRIESGPGDQGEGDVYWLPRENFYLPLLRFSAEELAALHTCLCLLDGQFAYSRLLRLALQSLALGSGNTLDDEVTDHISVNLLSSGFDSTIAARQARIEKAVARRKTIRFRYRSLGDGEARERTVDPYGMFLSRGNWYLVGYSHMRDDIRVFKLRRMEGRIRNATGAEHDFDFPEGFDLAGYARREPWQMGEMGGTAEIAISPRRAWWAGANLSHCGELAGSPGGGVVFRTWFADGRRLCPLVLGLGEDATVIAPEGLRKTMQEALDTVISLHRGEPRPSPETAVAESTGGADEDTAAEDSVEDDTGTGDEPADPGGEPQPQVEPERFPLLAQTITYLLDRLGDEQKATLSLEDVCSDLGFDRRDLEQTIDLLRLVNTGGGGYLIEAYVRGDELEVESWPEGELMKQPVRLSPGEARAMVLAIDLVGAQVLAGRFDSLRSAREKIIAAAGGLDESRTIPVAGAAGGGDLETCRAINRGLAEHRLVEIEYLSHEGDEPEARVVEPYLLNRVKSRWYLVAWCRKRDAVRTFRLEMIRSARLLDESFTPRDIDLERYRRDPSRPSGAEPPNRATVRFSPAVSRLVLERKPGARRLADGSLEDTIPYFSETWMVGEILKYMGEAEVLTPEGLRRRIVEEAEKLRQAYR
jgi:proteasome accessory factor C